MHQKNSKAVDKDALEQHRYYLQQMDNLCDDYTK
jgi:hypothetical protein